MTRPDGDVTGIDISPAMSARARRDRPVRLVVADIVRLPYPDASFHTVCATCMPSSTPAPRPGPGPAATARTTPTSRAGPGRQRDDVARRIAALEWALTPANWSGHVQIRSGLDGTVENRNIVAEHALASRTRVERGLAERSRHTHVDGDRAEHVLDLQVDEGETVRGENVAALCTSLDHAIADTVTGALADLDDAGSMDELARSHERAWERLWSRARLELHSDDPAMAGAVNLRTFR